MKVLVIGLGSMGKRRIRNLTHLQAVAVAGFDLREDRRTEANARYGIETFGSLDTALEAFAPDALVISTPPDLHLGLALWGLQQGKHVFCEIGTTDAGMQAVIDLSASSGLVAAASCTLRYQPSIKRMKALIDGGAIGQVLAYTHHCGQYLPDWHPFEDYRGFYVSRRETGACREIVPFELTWLTWLVGGPADLVTGMQGKLGGLDCDIDDVYHVLLRHGSGALGHVLVDAVARAPVRSTRILGSRGTLEWTLGAKLLRHFDADTKQWTDYPEPQPVIEAGFSEMSGEGMYIEEMADYLAACRGAAPFPNGFADELRVLQTLFAAETAFSTHTQVKMGGPA